MSTTVLVSGASGFIAIHIVNDLLQQGYKVIGTVRSQEKADKLTRQFQNNPNLSFELVADIAKLDAFDHVFQKHGKEIKIVLHTASPFHFNTTEYEKDLLIPAVNGTTGILESIKKYAADTVERFVVTSSFASIMDVAKQYDSSVVFNEKSWNPVSWKGAQQDAIFAYCGSKKFAEEAAWKFLEENKNVVKFKITAVNPVYVFGPQMFDEDVKGTLNTSCEFVNTMIHASADTKVEPNVFGHFIDVRDVSKAHILAFQKDELVGKRLLLANGPFGNQDIVNVLNEEFPVLKGKIPPAVHPTNSQSKDKCGCGVENEETRKLLGYDFMSFKDSIRATAEQILKKEGKL